MESRFVAYYRVSTKQQGLGLDAQRKIARTYVDNNNGKIVAEYWEKESAKHSNLNNRLELANALDYAKKNDCTLLVAKVDRLARDIEFIGHLLNNGTKFVCCDLPEFNTLTIAIFAGMAQHERDLISQRTKSALDVLKSNGVALGANNGKSHVYNADDRAKAYTAHHETAKNNINAQRAWDYVSGHCINSRTGERKKGWTLQKIADTLTAKGYPTPTGKSQWYQSTVANLIKIMND